MKTVKRFRARREGEFKQSMTFINEPLDDLLQKNVDVRFEEFATGFGTDNPPPAAAVEPSAANAEVDTL